MAVKALLFDFDGTLLDTNELILQSFMHVFDDKFPGKYKKEDFIRFIGPSLKETFSEFTPGEEDEMIRKYRAWNEKYHDELVSEFDGVVETLNILHDKGIRMVIVSSKIHKTVVHGLDLLGVTHLFELVIGSDDVQRTKPHPEPIEKALEFLQVGKNEVIMIGDNSHDIEGGQNAGVKTAGVAWSLRGVEFIQSLNPDYILYEMKDLLTIVSE